jgi:CO dehydrogenase maturation factor
LPPLVAAIAGKGGAGKTTVAALLVRRLVAAGRRPILAIDADPSSCLGSALGLIAPRTLGELREALRDGDGRPAAVARAEWLAVRAQEAVVEADGFDLHTMGRPEGPGCYCAINNLLRDQLARLGRAYRHVVVDCEAGLEHLSRRTAGLPDVLVCVADRSRQAAATVRRALGLVIELHRRLPPRVDLVLNRWRPADGSPGAVADLAGGGQVAWRRVWTVPEDDEVRAFEALGRSILELPLGSPALAALAGWEDGPWE